jgi:hypothetical protein
MLETWEFHGGGNTQTFRVRTEFCLLLKMDSGIQKIIEKSLQNHEEFYNQINN